MRSSNEALQLGELAFETYGDDHDEEFAGEYDEYGERILDVESCGPRDRQAEANAFLEQAMFKARRLVQQEEASEGESLFPTRNEALDQLLCGGLGRGEMVEMVGWRSSGRFSVVLSLLAATTQIGESVALVDLGDHLDPETAQDAGVDLERLLWLRPENIKQALGGAEMVLGAGFSLVILDLGTPPLPGGRGKEGAWLRLQRAALANRNALLVSTPYRASGSAAHAVVEMHRAAGGWMASPELDSRGPARTRALLPLLGGLFGAAELAKMRLARLKKLELRDPALSPSPSTTALVDDTATNRRVVSFQDHRDRRQGQSNTKLESSSLSGQLSQSLSRTALQMAVRFELRFASGGVSGLAAPLQKRRARAANWSGQSTRAAQKSAKPLLQGLPQDLLQSECPGVVLSEPSIDVYADVAGVAERPEQSRRFARAGGVVDAG